MRTIFGLMLGLLGCDGASGAKEVFDPQTGGESHFLEACLYDDDCGAALSCLCGICTRACESGACGDGATCVDSQDELLCGPATAICLPVCTDGTGICEEAGSVELPNPGAAFPGRFISVTDTTPEPLPDARPITHLLTRPLEASGEVVVLLSKSTARPQDAQVFLGAAAADGHFGLGVAFDTPDYPEAECAAEAPSTCHAAARARVVFGDVEPPLPATWETPDSLLFRLDRLLHHAVTIDPRIADLIPGGAVDWTRVHLIAHRDAAPLAVEIGRALPIASIGLIGARLGEGVSLPAEVPQVPIRAAARADDPRRVALEADWALIEPQAGTWQLGETPPRSATVFVDPAGLTPLEGTFDGLLLDQRLSPAQVHALRPLWRFLMGLP
jgi:hypothetical protein